MKEKIVLAENRKYPKNKFREIHYHVIWFHGFLARIILNFLTHYLFTYLGIDPVKHCVVFTSYIRKTGCLTPTSKCDPEKKSIYFVVISRKKIFFQVLNILKLDFSCLFTWWMKSQIFHMFCFVDSFEGFFSWGFAIIEYFYCIISCSRSQ